MLFDWQQIAVQFGEADLAWLMATSLDPEVRRAGHEDLVGAYGADIDRLRLGFVLPGLAALMLAQRTADHPRTRRFIATSLILAILAARNSAPTSILDQPAGGATTAPATTVPEVPAVPAEPSAPTAD